MASLSLVRLMIIAIISYAEAVDFFNILEMEEISNEIQGKKLIELTMQEIALTIPYFSEKGEVRSMIDADNKLGLSAQKCCQELLPLAMDNLNRSLTSDEGGTLSGTTLQTCVDGFEDQPRVMFEDVYKKLEHIIDHKWKGIRKNLSYAEATGFTVASFILQRNNWLLPTQVPYDLGL